MILPDRKIKRLKYCFNAWDRDEGCRFYFHYRFEHCKNFCSLFDCKLDETGITVDGTKVREGIRAVEKCPQCKGGK